MRACRRWPILILGAIILSWAGLAARALSPASEPPAAYITGVIPVDEAPSPMPAAKEGDKGKVKGAAGEKSNAEEDALLKINWESDVQFLDLASALRLAGVNNPQVLLARQKTITAVAQAQQAAMMALPDIRPGTSFDDHNGNLQQSSGNILKVDRNSFFAGFGAYAIAAGTVSIPGVGWNLHLSDTIFKALIARQYVAQTRFASRAVENEMLRRVAVAYTDLLAAQGRRALARLSRKEAKDVYDLSAIWAKLGAGRDADKDRAETELRLLEADLITAEGEVFQTSTRLAELLNMTPSTRLEVAEAKVVPTNLVPPNIPLSQLLAMAIANRPELQERNSVIRQAMLSLWSARALPFAPNMIIGLSYGAEGGGSNLVAQPVGTDAFSRGTSRFGNTAERLDFDAVFFWTAQNMGVGNVAIVRQARSRLQTANLQFLQTLDVVRADVAKAYVQAHARFAQMQSAEKAVQEIRLGFQQDYDAVRGNFGRPIELLDSLRLLRRARINYLDAIILYNQAQIDLYVALGQPPADVLVWQVPNGYVPPQQDLPAKKQKS
jgi:outer membrane protein TolC